MRSVCWPASRCPPRLGRAIAEDSFYTGGGTLNGRNGGSGWAGAWVTNGLGNHAPCFDATGGSLQFTPAGGATILGASEAVDSTGTVNSPIVYRQLASAQNGTFYVAYLVRLVGGAWTDTDTFSLHLANNGANTGTLNFGLRAQRHLHAYRLRQKLSRARLLGGGRQRGQHQRPKRRSVARQLRPR